MQGIWDEDSDSPDACSGDTCDLTAVDIELDSAWNKSYDVNGVIGCKRPIISRYTRRDAKFDAPTPLYLGILRVMPPDILYEVFMHLSPQDLLNLARTTKVLRNLLMSRRAIAVWRYSRQSDPDAPECPSDLSEPQWAELIWGGKACLECNRGGISIMVAIIFLRRRACMRCLTEHLVSEAKMNTRFPSYDPVVLRLVPHLQVKSSRTKHFWDEDMTRILDRLNVYNKAIERGVCGALEALECFKVKCETDIVSRMEHARSCEIWAISRG